jgi:hypothetical protein
MLKGASSRFGYAVTCDRMRQYAARCGKYAAKIRRCACCNAACSGLALGNASPTLGLEGKGITGERGWALKSLLDYSVFMVLVAL